MNETDLQIHEEKYRALIVEQEMIETLPVIEPFDHLKKFK